MLQPRRPWLHALRVLAAVAALALFGRVLSGANGSRVLELFAGAGALGLAAILLPQLAALSAESLGWTYAFRILGQKVRWSALLRVRLATEALAQSLPFGVAFAESIKPVLLKRHAGLEVAPAVAGMAARKYLLLLSQSIYVLGLGTLGFSALQTASESLIRFPGLGYIACGAGVALGVGALAIALALRQSELARATLSLLRRLPLARLREWLSRREPAFAATDGAVACFFRADARRTLAPALGFGIGWLLESVETFLILRLLGVELDFVTIASFEVVLSLVRNVAFFVPAGLGVQDLGYVACLAALGVPEAASVGAAFVLLKRAKELFWIAVGYGFLIAGVAPAAAQRRARMRVHGAVIGDATT
ncbi:MAG TPA: lysylphosphatidylglycerol synthase domain-containing protein [Polyangiaceae bacterium]